MSQTGQMLFYPPPGYDNPLQWFSDQHWGRLLSCQNQIPAIFVNPAPALRHRKTSFWDAFISTFFDFSILASITSTTSYIKDTLCWDVLLWSRLMCTLYFSIGNAPNFPGFQSCESPTSDNQGNEASTWTIQSHKFYQGSIFLPPLNCIC